MTMTPAIAQARIARELNDAETALNDALLRQSLLLTSLITARRDVETGHFVGQDALMRLVKSQQGLLTSGSDLARVHGRMLEIGQEVGGLSEDCPGDWKQIGYSDDNIAA